MSELHALSELSIRRCRKCNVIRHIEMFHRQKGGFMGKRAICKPCVKQVDADRNGNGRAAEAMRKRRAANPERYAAYTRNWAEANRDRRRETNRASQLRKLATPEGKLKRRMQMQLYLMLRGAKARRKTEELLGYSTAELKEHIERQFVTGMNWDNAGEWHIDHIVPLASFTITGPDDPELRRAWAMTNLRPLWAEDNKRKSAKREFLI